MIVLDTNVVSELMKPQPSPIVLQWIASRDRADFCTTSLSQAEILHGVRLLPSGRRRRAIEVAAEAMFKVEFAGRILAFDSDAARSYAELVSERRRRSRPISQFDAQIAAIARAAGVTLATHNVKDFDHCGIGIVDPWMET
jgi:predicted nucleic acid-binding protein